MRNCRVVHYEKNDLGHQLDHALEVTTTALDMNEVLGLKISEKMIYAAGLAHDIMVWKDRKKHHGLGADWVIENRYLKDCFNFYDRYTIAIAVYQHRASVKLEKFHSDLAELIASADRPAPIVDVLVKRVFLNNKDKQIALNHLKEKFGSGGYVWYPKMYKRYYGLKAIKELETNIDKLTLKDMEV